MTGVSRVRAVTTGNEHLTRVVGSEPEHHVTVVGHGYRVFVRRQIEMPVE